MSGAPAAAAAALALALVPASACAMNAPAAAVTCRVVGEGNLPGGSGGANALCAAIEEAIAAEAPQAKATVEVRVLSAHRLAATVTTADGRTLPEHNFASSDRALTSSSFRRFARAIAARLAQDSGR